MRRRHIIDPACPSPQFRGRCALAVMAKVPKPGQVKTRLSPPLNPQQSAALNIAFLRDTIACLKEVAAIVEAEPIISYTPPGEAAGFDTIIPDDVILLPQRGEGFGERLQHTAEDLLAAGFRAVCLIDSDSPTVPKAAYVTAVERLLCDEDCAVLGPSEDGGYYLLGMNAPHPPLFRDIVWSSAAVLEQTLQRARAIDLPVYLLPAWFDIDDSRTLVRLLRELVGSCADREGFTAEHTREYLCAIADSLNAIPMIPSMGQGEGQ